MSIETLGGALDVNSNEAALWSETMRLKSENEWLRARLLDAEMSLAVYDDGQSSEYWLRYPERINQQITQTEKPDAV